MTAPRWLESASLATIGAAAVVAGLDASGVDTGAADAALTASLAIEVAIRWRAAGTCRYLRDGWAWLDLGTLAASCVPGIGSLAMVARLARILRVLRLVRALPDLRRLVGAILRSIRSLAYVAGLLSLVLYAYAVVGVDLWSSNDPGRYGDIPSALLTLFRVMTLEDWTDVMYTAMHGCSVYPSEAQWTCDAPAARPVLGALYHVSFVALAAVGALNLVVGVITDALASMRGDD